jgi:hypothetical protein
LVNYLPNRMSLLSETAPPPRNPRLQYCIEEYTFDQFTENRDRYDSALAQVSDLDLSLLPKKMAKDLQKSFDAADGAIAALTAVKTAEQAVIDNEDRYRPIHTKVRRIQSNMRKLGVTAEELRVSSNRLFGENVETRRVELEERVADLEAQINSLEQSIPSEWENEYTRHSELQQFETKARNDYRRMASDGYETSREISEILAATTDLRNLGSAIPDMKTLMATNEPADLLDPLKALAAEFGDIAGASKIKSAVSKARSILRKKNPDTDAAMKSIDKAMAEYEKELGWRSAAEPAVLADLQAYEREMSGTIGIRQQDRLTRVQSLAVASCSSHHRDISLNF